MSQSSLDATPNAQLRSEQIRSSLILCCGEDKRAFLHALSTLGFSVVTSAPEFRGYTTWTLPSVTIILAGIGTGALEPLLYEILTTGQPERIVLVGTAGCLRRRHLPLGVAYPIAEAHLAGTGLDREVADQPLRPNWPDFPSGASATMVSSDFYYGFSPSLRPGDYRQRLPALRADFDRLSARADLVDMEVGQFYALCRLIPERAGLQFLAIKGASNAVDNHGEQNENAPAVLLDCLKKAMAALGLAAP